jgi:cephalosporin hydroxylase
MMEKMSWQEDRMLIGDIVFRLEQKKNSDWTVPGYFSLYKVKSLVDQYEKFFSLNKSFRPKRILEIGMWDGGSLALWSELLNPTKLVGVDLKKRPDSDYFKQYVEERQLADVIKTYWGVDQADQKSLKAILDAEFPAQPIDMVIDDGSHLYAPTKASFELVFPRMKPGGYYIVEDWAWSNWPGLETAFPNQVPLNKLLYEILDAIGTSSKLISNIQVCQGFAAICRGETPLDSPFKLDAHIYRHPQTS